MSQRFQFEADTFRLVEHSSALERERESSRDQGCRTELPSSTDTFEPEKAGKADLLAKLAVNMMSSCQWCNFVSTSKMELATLDVSCTLA